MCPRRLRSGSATAAARTRPSAACGIPVQRQGQLPVHRQLVHRRLLRRLDDAVGHPVLARLGDHRRVERIEEDLQLLLVQLALVLATGHFVDAVGVVEQHAEVADAPDAGLRADGGLAGLDARVAEDALLGLAALPVEVDLLVRAAGDAHPPAAALVLVDQDDAVLLALVDRPARAGRHARRVQAVLAEARQVHHEGVLVLTVDVRLDLVEVLVLAPLGELGAEDLLPVRAPLDLLHALPGDQRARARHRLVLGLGRGMQVLVVEVERFVVVVDLGQVRVGEDVRQHAELAADARADRTVCRAHPAALPLLLVFPFLRVADPGLGLDVVEPGVLHAFAAGPDVLAGDRAGVATDAFVEVQHHADLRTNFHGVSPQMSWGSGCGRASPPSPPWRGSSSQSTLLILRTTTNSSRLQPTVP